MGQNNEDPYEIDLEWKKIEKDMIKVSFSNCTGIIQSLFNLFR